ncbi:3'(2'),5'-bisphosphate nucleotidase CysQ [Aurantimonas endophytica]|uniref:Myo-inositol-1(Or 4)-monophosphatase n=1 Tax=Aurantimonas endophytica TaxID=1522175 RepID=A0A7W6HCX9_9HYPH|nr:3'(2'),5'-bisphosphate nucleotidase CysQ [Aurantimonas endophytica]MBB4002876.1 myo-inositol-1(or 4)-monophosphatase [Aurantimonas endophytica]
MTGFSEDLALISGAAKAAGDLAMRYFRQDPKVWWKEGNSPVSEADYAVDALLKQTLLDARPDYGWLSEEMVSADMRDVGSARFFVVDPIDGTRAFLRGEDTWCVSVAVVENGRPVAGVIAATALGEHFEVTADTPTRMNGAVCAVSSPGPEDALRLAVPDSMRKRLHEAAGSTVLLEKAVPSLAYRLALVASGRIDGTLVRPRANDWDIAAADLLIERAGGLLSDRHGDASLYRSHGKRHGLLIASSLSARDRVRRLAGVIPDRTEET